MKSIEKKAGNRDRLTFERLSGREVGINQGRLFRFHNQLRKQLGSCRVLAGLAC
jgi:hypothetical protein